MAHKATNAPKRTKHGRLLDWDWCDRDGFIRVKKKGKYVVTVRGDQIFGRDGKLKERRVGMRKTYDGARALMGRAVCGRKRRFR